MNLQKTVAATEQQKQVEFLNHSFYAFKAHKKIRTWLEIANNTLSIDWLSYRGIKDKFNTSDYEDFIKKTFLQTGDKKATIVTLFTSAEITNLAEIIADEIAAMYEDKDVNFKPIMAYIITCAKNSNGNEITDYLTAYTGAADTAPQEQAPEPQPQEQAETKQKQAETKEQPQVPQAPQVMTTATETSALFSLNIPINEMVNSAVSKHIEDSKVMQQVEAKIIEAAKKLVPTLVTVNNREAVKFEGKLHKDFKDALNLLIMAKQLYIAGDAGTGKTTLAGQCAKSLNIKFEHISCTAGMAESHLTGRLLANGDYLQSSFVDCYENGGLFLFDEVDAADANTLLIINSALANGHISIVNRPSKPTALRHADFYCVCAANTFGYGSNEFAGRNILDRAFIDRFVDSVMLLDYDNKLEQEILVSNDKLYAALNTIRANVNKYKIRRAVSTRAYVGAARFTINGHTNQKFLDTFFTSWSAEEKRKAMENVNI